MKALKNIRAVWPGENFRWLDSAWYIVSAKIFRRFPQEVQSIAREQRINEQIRAREVRVIDEQGVQLGIMPLPEALRLARERMADLVEVASQADPPVCRFLDYGKWKYEQSKREREARKHQKTGELREVRLRPKIDAHDVEYRLRQAQEFLADGDKVKISVLFRARELGHLQLGRKLLERALEELKSVALVERTPVMEGRTMYIVLAPSKTPSAPRLRTVASETQAVAAEAS